MLIWLLLVAVGPFVVEQHEFLTSKLLLHLNFAFAVCRLTVYFNGISVLLFCIDKISYKFTHDLRHS